MITLLCIFPCKMLRAFREIWKVKLWLNIESIWLSLQSILECLRFLTTLLHIWLYKQYGPFFFLFIVLGIEPRTLCMLYKCTSTELYSQPLHTHFKEMQTWMHIRVTRRLAKHHQLYFSFSRSGFRSESLHF